MKMRRLVTIISSTSLGLLALVLFVPKTPVFGGGGCPKVQAPPGYTAGGPSNWYHDAINADAAWQHARNCQDVVVAVLDKGFDLGQPSLAGHLWTNSDEANGRAGADDDGNGCVDDAYGCSFSGTEPNGTLSSAEDAHGRWWPGSSLASRPTPRSWRCA